jgi:hypothetical protein
MTTPTGDHATTKPVAIAKGKGHLTGPLPFPAAARRELSNAQLRVNLR